MKGRKDVLLFGTFSLRPNDCERGVRTLEQWVTVRDAASALDVSERTVYKRLKRGELEREARNGRTYVLVDGEVLNGSAQSEPQTDEVQNAVRELELRVKEVERERDRLRSELDMNDSARSELHRQVSESLTSIRALTEQNERLTILLANEQASRMKMLPQTEGWVHRLFGRKRKQQVRIGHA